MFNLLPSTIKCRAFSTPTESCVSCTQATELADRQALLDQEIESLRTALSQVHQATDEGLELGKLQWDLLQERRNAGEARRREAAAQSRLHHVQAQLYRLQIKSDEQEATLFEALEWRNDTENEQASRDYQ